VGTAGDVGRDFGGTFGPRRWLVGLACADPQFTRRITVIDTNFAANQNAVAGIALKSNIFSDVAHIDLRCGGGHGSVMFGPAAEAEGHFQLSPSVGDVLRVSIFRNVAACRDEFTATNTRTNNTKMVMVRTRAR
jgi:hypothetical protein